MSDEHFQHAYAGWEEIEEEEDTSVAPVCERLRTKTAFGSLAGSTHRWQEGKSTTAVYWCLATMTNSGPDDQVVHPRLCRGERGCFRNG